MSRFAGLTRSEVAEFFDEQKDQLNLVTMLEFLSTAEAILRLDFETRVAARKKDSLSRRYRQIESDRDKVRLDEDLLDAMAEEGVNVSDFRGALRLRHWLAHGRYWAPKLGQSYTPQVVFDISKSLIDSIP